MTLLGDIIPFALGYFASKIPENVPPLILWDDVGDFREIFLGT